MSGRTSEDQSSQHLHQPFQAVLTLYWGCSEKQGGEPSTFQLLAPPPLPSSGGLCAPTFLVTMLPCSSVNCSSVTCSPGIF